MENVIDDCRIPGVNLKEFTAVKVAESQCPSHDNHIVVKIVKNNSCSERGVVDMWKYSEMGTNRTCNGEKVYEYKLI